MAHRRSQAEAFRVIQSSGLLRGLQWQTYRVIAKHQGAEGVTSGELDRALSQDAGTFTRSASPRLNELVRMGVLEELPRRECKATGARVISYRTTGRLPDKAALKRRVSLSKADKSRAREALLRLWEHVPEADRPVVKRLGLWLAQQSEAAPEDDVAPRQNPQRVRREDRAAESYDRRMERAASESDPEAGREALAKLIGGIG
jgi:uncharacterized protein YdaU (DUF1376 family)